MLFVEHARVEVGDGCVELIQVEGSRGVAYNIPYANTAFLMLGEGCSITRDAVRALASHDVVLGFTGGGGVPLLAAMDNSFPTFVEPQSEYRPTEFMTKWSKIYFDDARRLNVAKCLLKERVSKTAWLFDKNPAAKALAITPDKYLAQAQTFLKDIDRCDSTTDLLTAEARQAKLVYKLVAQAAGIEGFTRNPGGGDDIANNLLDHANYLAYGAASVAIHGLGIPFGMAVLHGKTRRGGLVFDIADLIKDGLTLTCAFYAASKQMTDQEMRNETISTIHNLKLIPYLFDTIKELVETC
jgi:CRISPR-associated protein Cas1